MKSPYIFITVFALSAHQQLNAVPTIRQVTDAYLSIPAQYRIGAIVALSGLEGFTLYKTYHALKEAQRYTRNKNLTNQERIAAYLKVQELQARFKLLGGVFALPLLALVSMELFGKRIALPPISKTNSSKAPATKSSIFSSPTNQNSNTAKSDNPTDVSSEGVRSREIRGRGPFNTHRHDRFAKHDTTHDRFAY